jgi:cyanate permease
LIFVTVIYFLGLLGFVVLIFWMPQLIKNSGIGSPQTVGELSAIPWLVSGFAMMLISMSSDRSGERKWHMVFSTFVSGIGYIICAEFPSHPPIVIGGLSLAMLGYLGCNPILFSLPSLFLSGVALASGIALINTIGNIASIFGPAFIGWLTDLTKSTHLSIEIIGLLVIFNGLLTATLWPFGGIPLSGTSGVRSLD